MYQGSYSRPTAANSSTCNNAHQTFSKVLEFLTCFSEENGLGPRNSIAGLFPSPRVQAQSTEFWLCFVSEMVLVCGDSHRC